MSLGGVGGFTSLYWVLRFYSFRFEVFNILVIVAKLIVLSVFIFFFLVVGVFSVFGVIDVFVRD